MKKFVLFPHINGMGHRVRCDRLGRDLLGADSSSKVRVGIRPDDPVDPSTWTVVRTTRSTLGRTWSILTASVLIQDGYVFLDSRVRMMRRRGGKLVLILHPWGFPADPSLPDVLEAADLILVPFPLDILQAEPPLERYAQKVRIIPPILDMSTIERTPPSDHLCVYCSVSRPLAGFDGLIEEMTRLLGRRFKQPVELIGEPGRVLDARTNALARRRAHAVITQGAITAFESLASRIPVVMVPLPDSEEQVETARRLAVAGMARYIPASKLTAESLASAIESLVIANPPPEAAIPGTGLAAATRHLRSLAGLADTTEDRPHFTIIGTNYNCGHALEQHLTSIYNLFKDDEFEYVLVDNYSTDSSPQILRKWEQEHPNLRILRYRCRTGRGREIAARHARASTYLVVDTDTVYHPLLCSFVKRAMSDWPQYAVQAIYAGVFPRFLWRVVGGRGNFNVGEDFDMWMRIWQIGRMKWYPIVMGQNLKDRETRDAEDHLSLRYGKLERLTRLGKREFDGLRLSKYERLDLEAIRKDNEVDFGLGPVESTWFGRRSDGSLKERLRYMTRAAVKIIKS